MQRPRTCRGADDGVTLIELLVVVLLLSVVSALMYGFLDNTTAVSGRVDADVAAEREAILALRRMSQDIRSANPILVTTASPAGIPTCSPAPSTTYGNCLEFVISRNTSLASATFCTFPGGKAVALPYRRTVYRLGSGSVLENRYEHTTSCTTASSSSVDRPVIARVVNPASQPLFTFLERSGADIGAAQPISNVGSVRINLSLSYRANTAPLVLGSVAALRNYR